MHATTSTRLILHIDGLRAVPAKKGSTLVAIVIMHYSVVYCVSPQINMAISNLLHYVNNVINNCPVGVSERRIPLNCDVDYFCF